ncbi:MAG TPA: hypothetical protein VFV72_10535 [Candidatus Limnocylindrales bacterium]|nr:hypothetical protein [Candidatus Limnocylindrales bacterium]
MTTDRRAEIALRALFENDLTELPDRVLDAVVAELPATPQQRRLPRLAKPWNGMRLAVATIAIVIAVVLGAGFLSRPTGPSQPSASPSPPASPAATATSSPSSLPSPAPGYASAPPGWPTPEPYLLESPLPDPAGSPLPGDLIGRQYNTDPLNPQGIQAEVLTLRAADDPHCVPLFAGRSTCFTILWTPNYPKHIQDYAVRGSARLVGEDLVLAWDVVPNDPECQGTSSTYAISADRSTLTGIDVDPCSYGGFVEH